MFKFQFIKLKVARLDNADAPLPSKLDNSGGYNKDVMTQLTSANIIFYHVYINAIVNYYNILQLKELANIKI